MFLAKWALPDFSLSANGNCILLVAQAKNLVTISLFFSYIQSEQMLLALSSKGPPNLSASFTFKILFWANLISHLYHCYGFPTHFPVSTCSSMVKSSHRDQKTFGISHFTQSTSQSDPQGPCTLWTHYFLLFSFLTSLQPHWPCSYSSGRPGLLLPQDLCTCLSSAWTMTAHISLLCSFRIISTCHLLREPSLTPLFKTENKHLFQLFPCLTITKYYLFKNFMLLIVLYSLIWSAWDFVFDCLL